MVLGLGSRPGEERWGWDLQGGGWALAHPVRQKGSGKLGMGNVLTCCWFTLGPQAEEGLCAVTLQHSKAEGRDQTPGTPELA